MSQADPAQLLEWDSAFWGTAIGRVSGDVLTDERRAEIDDWARERSVECLYFLARADDPRTLALAGEAGFDLVDVRLELGRLVGEEPQPSTVRAHRAGDLPRLRAIARTSYDSTRFFADPRFPDERCRDLYETWIDESCNGWADIVLVSERNGDAVGYVTCHLDESRTASIGLIGVASESRGRGLGGELVSAALRWSSDQRAVEMSVVTQGANLPAQRLFQRCGFRTSSVGLWFHKWYSG